MRLFIGAILGAGVAGTGYFAAGFFGPILFMPSANQGPLFGIFISGPIGVVVGGLMGLALAAFRAPRATAGTIGAAVGILVGVPFLFWGDGELFWLLFLMIAGPAVFGTAAVLVSVASTEKSE